jgi:hypothetical protein
VIDNAPISHSRNLLLSGSGPSAVGAAGKSKAAPISAVAVERVDTTTKLKPQLAFQQFAGALYTGAGTSRSNGTFEAGPSALLVAGSHGSVASAALSSSSSAASDAQAIRLKFENPFVKLQRLQEELKDFDAELKAALAQQPKPAAGSPKAGAKMNGADAADEIWANLAGNVQQLQGQLDSMLGQPAVAQLLQQNGQAAPAGSIGAGSSLLPQFDTLFDQYVAALSTNPAFQPFPAGANSASPAPAATGGASSAELAALPKLDERLHTLEKFLGTSAGTKQPALPMVSFNSSSSSSSSTVLPAPDLITALSSLHSQLSQLNPARLELVSRSCKQLLIEQESLQLQGKGQSGKDEEAASKGAGSSEQKEDAATTGTDALARPYAAQVAHLYALTSRWDSLALSLPALITRLSSLHSLHSSSAVLVQRVVDLERQSAAIDSALQAQREGVSAVAEAAQDNLQGIKENFRAMDTRIQELAKKMEQLGGK